MSTFASMLAVDENGYVANGATGQIFAPTDTAAATPLDITDLNGIAFAGNQITASALGVLPTFRCVGFPVVDWVSGDYRIPIPAIDLVPAGGVTGQILAKVSGTNFDFEWVTPAAPAPGGGGTTGGAIQYVRKPSGGSWGGRPTTDPAVVVIWIGADPSPSIVTSGTAGMRDGIDLRFVTP